MKSNDNSWIVSRTPAKFVSVGTFDICDIKNGDSYEDCH